MSNHNYNAWATAKKAAEEGDYLELMLKRKSQLEEPEEQMTALDPIKTSKVQRRVVVGVPAPVIDYHVYYHLWMEFGMHPSPIVPRLLTAAQLRRGIGMLCALLSTQHQKFLIMTLRNFVVCD
jgi:hypothetical protein